MAATALPVPPVTSFATAAGDVTAPRVRAWDAPACVVMMRSVLRNMVGLVGRAERYAKPDE